MASRRLLAIFAIGAFVFALAVKLWVDATPVIAQPSRVQGTYSKDNGYFYRFQAKFKLKETGEAVDFDYVVACNIRLTRWRDGGLSDDSTFSPRMMVKTTTGGQAVMLQTLRHCSGLTSENDDIPPDVLPMAIWFDSVDDLSSGLGYVSEDAYESPLSKLTFHGARIDRATRADWETWRKRSADEYVQRGALPGPWGHDYNDIGAARARYVGQCRGYRRLKLPDVIAAKLRPLWPAARPWFWTVPNEDDHVIAGFLTDTTVVGPPGEAQWIKRFGTPGSGGGSDWSGMPVRSGRWVQLKPHVPSRWPTETYPYFWPPMTSASPLTVAMSSAPAESYVHKLDFRGGAFNGFAACQSAADWFGERIAGVDPGWWKKLHIFMVDDQIVRQQQDGQVFFLEPAFVLERDQYVFIRFSAGL